MTTTKTKKTAAKALEAKDPTIVTTETEIPKNSSNELAAVLQEAALNNDQIVVEVTKETKVSIKKKKTPKAKVIRDSFSFPEQDYLKISELKKACLEQGIHVKKGEILRAGLHLMSALNIDQLKQSIEQVERVKTGRPKA